MGKVESKTNKIASVILCTYNRASLLKRALESLAKQTMVPEELEIVVVDDGSGDETQNVVREMSTEHSSVKLVSAERNLGASGARNLGLAAATGKYILFTDDDCIIQDDWVKTMCSTLDNEPVVSGCIDSSKSGYTKLCHNITHFHPYMPGRKSGPVDFLAGANMGFHRSVLDELGGFDEDLILAGDMQLCLRAKAKGYQPYLNTKAVVVHAPDYISLPRAIESSFEHAARTVLLRNEFRSLLGTPFILKYPILILLFSPLIALSVTSNIYFRNPGLLSSFWTVPFVYLLKLVWCFGAAYGLKKSK